MDLKELYIREKNAVVHGQTVRFRIIKYIVLCALFSALYLARGLYETLQFFGVLFILSIIVHFFFRWKSDGWTKSWWLYKHIPVDKK